MDIPGYNLLRYDRGRDELGNIKRGGGLCTFVKIGLLCTELPEYTIADKNIELSTVKYKLPFTRDIYVLNVYRPPNGDIDVFVDCIQQCTTELRDARNCDIFIGGDMNIDMLRPNTQSYKKISKFNKLNQLRQLIKTTTRPDSNTCLDLIITNCDITLKCCIPSKPKQRVKILISGVFILINRHVSTFQSSSGLLITTDWGYYVVFSRVEKLVRAGFNRLLG